MKKGLIVSVQGYSLDTTQELANIAVQAGAVAIRTDQPINQEVPIIGLVKNFDYEYYITPTREDLIAISKHTDIAAIDSRKGNPNLKLLYSHAHVNNIKIVADIYTIEDVESILAMCEKDKIVKPAYIATTFNFKKPFSEKRSLLKEIKRITDIPIIAEGGYKYKPEIEDIKGLVNNVCVGNAITGIEGKTKELCY